MDTSIKHPISDQSTPMVNGCMDIMFAMVDILLLVILVIEEHS